MASNAVSGQDHQFFKYFAGGRLLVAIIFLGAGVLFIVLWAKRQILRLFLINRKGPVDHPGTNTPKYLKRTLDENFNRIAEMRIEPKLLCDVGEYEPAIYSSYVQQKDDSSYKYRRKAFGLMSCLDELLSRVNISLSRQSHQSVRQHVTSLQGPPYSPFEGNPEICEMVTNLYEHARYGAKEFTEFDYQKYSNSIDHLYNMVHQKFPIPGSLVVNSEHHHLLHSDFSTMNDSAAISESGILLPSVLVADKTSLRCRSSDTSRIQDT